MPKKMYNPNGGKSLDQMTREDMLYLYAELGTFDACAVRTGCNRNSWRKYWYELNLPNPATIPKKPQYSESEVYEFLAASDLHIGSNHQQIHAFLEFTEVGIDNDIRTMVIPGDIVEGLHKREGSAQCRFLQSIDAIYDYTCDVFSQFADNYEKIYVINGNHDETLNKRDDGFDLCKHLAKDFSSVKYEESPAGMVKPVTLDGGAKAILYHGDGSCTCNLTQRTRSKTIDFINMDEDFSFLLAGHCHRSSPADLWLQKYGISLGCFQSITEFLARKGKQPQVQGQRIQYQIDKRGKVCNVVNIPYNYNNQLIKNDIEL